VRTASLALVAAVSLFVASCGSQVNHGTPAVPRITPAAAAATRSYLLGPGSGLLQMNSMASTLTHSAPADTCKNDATALVRIASASSPSAQMADQQLAELLVDEESALAAVLAQCSAQSSSSVGLDKLGGIHADVTSRLKSDGVSS
jgi:hypothetical protein